MENIRSMFGDLDLVREFKVSLGESMRPQCLLH